MEYLICMSHKIKVSELMGSPLVKDNHDPSLRYLKEGATTIEITIQEKNLN